MLKTYYPNFEPSSGYMTETVQRAYISKAIEINVLPKEAHRMPEIISLVASNDSQKPIQFWQLFSVLGQNNIVRIVQRFYDRVYKDEPWFTSVFARIGDATHHMRTQASMWLDVMGGGLFYHGAEFRLNFHHQHNAFEIMNEKGAEPWLKLMIETLNESEQYMTNDSRVRTSVNTFLTHFMEKYMLDFDFQIDELFGPVNKPIIRKINFLNMTDVAIEDLSEIELREGLAGRGVNLEKNVGKAELIRLAKNL